MGTPAKSATMQQRIPAMTDKRLEALSFNAWRIASGGDVVRKQKAKRLRPLVLAEIATRKGHGAKAS